MSFERGDILWATDPFREGDGGRAWLVVGDDDTPFHDDQHICLALTTKTWHEESIPIDGTDLADGGTPEDSSILPWSVVAIPVELVDRKLGKLRESAVDDATRRLCDYIGS